jgi:hypothetical protein
MTLTMRLAPLWLHFPKQMCAMQFVSTVLEPPHSWPLAAHEQQHTWASKRSLEICADG